MKHLRTTLSNTRSLIGKTFALLFITGSCVAEESEKEEWKLSLGAGVFHAPEFSGADEYETRVIPVFRAEYGRFTFGGSNGISYDFYKDESLESGVSLGYFSGREESDAEYLQGLGDLESSADLGAYIKKSFGPFYISANIKRDFSDDVGGITAGLATGFSYKATKQLVLNTSLSSRWMNDEHAQAVYGISQEQAMLSTLPETVAEAGMKSATLSFTALYFINRQWTLMGSINQTQLLGDAKTSPITRDSDPVTVVTTISYRF